MGPSRWPTPANPRPPRLHRVVCQNIQREAVLSLLRLQLGIRDARWRHFSCPQDQRKGFHGFVRKSGDLLLLVWLGNCLEAFQRVFFRRVGDVLSEISGILSFSGISLLFYKHLLKFLEIHRVFWENSLRFPKKTYLRLSFFCLEF